MSPGVLLVAAPGMKELLPNLRCHLRVPLHWISGKEQGLADRGRRRATRGRRRGEGKNRNNQETPACGFRLHLCPFGKLVHGPGADACVACIGTVQELRRLPIMARTSSASTTKRDAPSNWSASSSTH